MGEPVRPQFVDVPDGPEAQKVHVDKAPAALDPIVDAGTDAIRDRANDVIQKSALRVDLEQKLAGIATVEDVKNLPNSELLKGKEVFAIKVKDKEKWRSDENFKNLVPAFARILHDVFEERDAESRSDFPIDDSKFVEHLLEEYFRYSDIAEADTIYAIAEGEKVIGLYMDKDFEIEGFNNARYSLLTCVDKSRRDKGYGELLSRINFANADADVIVRLTHTPAAVRNRLNTGNEYGFNSYFCGYRDGDRSKPLSDREMELLAMAKRGIDAQTTEYELGGLQDGVPDAYVSYGTEGISPRRMEEVNFPEGNPLRETFQELVDWQQKNRPDDCIYGTLIHINRRLL